MAIATQAQILKVLKAFNPWWVTGAVHPDFTKHYRRFAYYEAMKRLEQRDLRRTVVLTGTRRVGKTTIQYQMIDTLLKRGVPPQRIVFISLDHPMSSSAAWMIFWIATTPTCGQIKTAITSSTKCSMPASGTSG